MTIITKNLLIYQYANGSYTIKLFEDGTKIREGDIKNPIFPESIDVKITNYCDIGCKYCHEDSTTDGKHSNLNLLVDLVDGCPAGVELAIGGGDPLSHPNLQDVLASLKEKGIICNLTVNMLSLKNDLNYSILKSLIENELIYGVGISVSGRVSDYEEKLKELFSITNNIVFHVIAGVNTFSVVDELRSFKEDFKMLVLGYKQVRRGKDFFGIRESKVTSMINHWMKNIQSLIGTGCVISFDNLAIKQLKIKRLFTDKEWEEFYMGDDGVFTFYIDLVKEEFAVSSTSQERFKINGKKNIEMFKEIRGL